MSIKRKWDISSDETRREAIDEIIGRIDETLNEKIGVITAEDILDIVIQRVGPDVYNKAISDVKEMLQKRNDDLEIDIDLLQQKN